MKENMESINVKEQENPSLETILETERSYAPLVDIYETNEDYILIANLPGVKREDVKLKFEEGALIIFGKIDYKESLNKEYLLNETQIGNFYRKFNISDSIDESKIEAKHENGQLLVKLPKHERVKPKTINIK